MRKSSLLAVSRAVAVGLIKRAGRCATALILFASFVNAVHGQTAHFAGTETSIGSGYASPHGVAIDSKGNVFVADTYNNLVKEIVAVNGSIPPSPSIRISGSGFSFPWSIAVDASGNVFVADWGNGAIKEIQAVNGSIPDSPVIATLVNVNSPVGVALDSAANVYYTDTEYGLIKEILHSTGYASVVTLATEFWNGSEWVFMHLGGLAVDSSGDVFATDSADNAVYEIVAVNGSIPPSPSIRLVAGGFNNPEGLAVDGNGNIVVADYNNNVIKEVLAVNGSIPSSPTVISLGYGLHYPSGVAVDAAGDVLIADTGNSRAVEETISSVTYGSIGVGITSNAAQLTFAFDTAGTLGSTSVVTQGATGLDFSNAGTGSCAANTAYSAGQSCTVNVSFTPLFPGSRSGAVEINDSNGNVMATALLQGTGVGPQLSFSPGTQTTLGSSFSYAAGIAVDGSGNAYVVDVINNLGNVQEVMAVNGRIPANPTVRTLVGNLDCPVGPALDAAGNVYFADVCYHTVNEIQAVNGTIPSSPTIRTLTSQFTSPDGIAVDSRGNVTEVAWSVADPPGFDEHAALPVCVTLHGRGSGHSWVFETRRRSTCWPTPLGRADVAPFAIASVDGGDATELARAGRRRRPRRWSRRAVPMLAARGLDTDLIGPWGWSLGGYGVLRWRRTSGSSWVAAVAASSRALWATDLATAAGHASTPRRTSRSRRSSPDDRARRHPAVDRLGIDYLFAGRRATGGAWSSTRPPTAGLRLGCHYAGVSWTCRPPPSSTPSAGTLREPAPRRAGSEAGGVDVGGRQRRVVDRSTRAADRGARS